MVCGLASLILLAPVATVDDLVEVEASFTRSLQAHGSKRAYADALAPKGIRFRASDEQAIIWRKPSRAGLSRGENWGYTSGNFKAKGRDGAILGGQYVSLWRRNGGGWRLLFDFAAPSVASDLPFQAIESRFEHKIIAEPDDAVATLIATDRALADDPTTIAEFLDSRAAIVRNRVGLLERHAAIRAIRDESWSPIKALVAPSADLGCTYGASSYKEGGRGDYVRIWARNERGSWRVVLDFGAKR